MKTSALISIAALSAALSACGGGGIGDEGAKLSAEESLGATTTTAGHVDRVLIQWPDGKIPVYYVDNGRPPNVQKEVAIGAIENATALWSVACGVNMYYAGESTDRLGIDAIRWGSPTNYYGIAETLLGAESGDPKWFRIVINNEEDGWGHGWYAGDDTYISRTLDHITLHELGHVVGLGHTDDKDDVMYPGAYETGGITEADSTACSVY